MTFKILNGFTNKIINMSDIRSANYKAYPNLRSDPATYPEVITSLREDKLEDEDATSETSLNEEDPDSESLTNDVSSPY